MKHCNSCCLSLRDSFFIKGSNRCKVCQKWNIPLAFNNEVELSELHDYYRNITSKAKQILRSYKRTDKEKNREFNLTLKYIEKQLIKPCIYCGHHSTGLDRKNNNIGHTEDNCVPCCYECNVIRMDKLTHEDMFVIGEAMSKVKTAKVSPEQIQKRRILVEQMKHVDTTKALRPDVSVTSAKTKNHNQI